MDNSRIINYRSECEDGDDESLPLTKHLLNRTEEINNGIYRMISRNFLDDEDPHNKTSESCPDLTVKRPILTVPKKHEKYKYSKPKKPGLSSNVKKAIKEEFSCSSKKALKLLFLRLPILDWIIHYDVKNGLLGDVISGITVAVMHIPQGMAYAMLANLDPISGIYMAFFPVFVYAIFASSRHLSMGTFAVICLMTGKVVSEYATFPPDISGVTTEASTYVTTMAPNGTEVYTATEVSTIVCFGVGVWMMVFGFLNVGSLSVFLSDMLVSGFTTGAAIHVFTSQVKSLFGVSIQTYNGTFKVILTWGAIFKNILDSNPATMVISTVCIIVLLFNNEVIKPRLRKVSQIPIPIELIVVVCGTLAGRYGHLDNNYDVVLVGPIPTGLPPPTLPPFDLYGQVVIPCLTITIVSYTVSFSMAKIFAKKKDYVVDATQELYATGLGNLVGCLFECAPISASMSRSLIQVSVGGYTQLTSFISCGIVLMVLLYIGPFFETLPNCVLAAIIVTALKGMFLQFGDFKRILKIDRIEATLWMVTFLGVVIIDIDYGLFIGIAFSIILLLAKNQMPYALLLGNVPNTDIYLDKNRYASVTEVAGIKICQLSGVLHYANQEVIRSAISECSGLNPGIILKKKKKIEKAERKLEKKMNKMNETSSLELKNRNGSLDLRKKSVENRARLSISSLDISVEKGRTIRVEQECPALLLDMSGISQIDVSASKNIALIYADFRLADVQVYFAGMSEKCLETMERSRASKDIPQERFFHTIHDAVLTIKIS